MENSSVCCCSKLWKLITVYSFKLWLDMHTSQQAFAWILSYFDFSLSLGSALFMFCICCAVCCQQYLSGRHALWNTIYRASVYCIPKRNDRPLAKDLSESRLFTLETVAEWKYAGQSAIYHCCAPHRKIPYFIMNTEIISKHVLYCMSAVSSSLNIDAELYVYSGTTFQ